MGRKLTIRIEHDHDTDNPCDMDCQWKLYSFNWRHINFKHPENFFNASGKPKTALANKLRVGLAFVLGYHEHGLCQWALSGEQHPCEWDSVNVAGVLVWEHKADEIGGKTKEDRAKDARGFLEEYTAWCNGETYWFAIEGEDGETLESCGGFIGAEYLFESIAEFIEPGDEWEFAGDMADVASYYEDKLKKAAAKVPA